MTRCLRVMFPLAIVRGSKSLDSTLVGIDWLMAAVDPDASWEGSTAARSARLICKWRVGLVCTSKRQGKRIEDGSADSAASVRMHAIQVL